MSEEVIASAETIVVERIKSVKGAIQVPGDELISHLALVIGSVSQGETVIRDLAPGQNVERTLGCLRELGLEIRRSGMGRTATVVGKGIGSDSWKLDNPPDELHCGNSLITVQLLAGLLAALGLEITLVGDEQLNTVPMDRIAEPLRLMDAKVELSEEGTLPMRISSWGLKGLNYKSQTGHASIKASVLIAGLGAGNQVKYSEPLRSADHAEKLLKNAGASIETRTTGGGKGEYTVVMEPGAELLGREIDIPGDFSKALYPLVAALLLPKSDLILKDVGLNPGRREALNVLNRMGAKIEVKNRKTAAGESRGDLHVRRSKLKGIGLTGKTLSLLLDEIPAITVAAAFAEGETYFKSAEDLRTMGTDRIAALVHNLKALGVEVGESPDGLVFRGKRSHDGGEFDSFGDYRIALAFHICALASHGESTISNYDVIGEAWPEFPIVMEALKI